jgi:transcription elongation factor Elf1
VEIFEIGQQVWVGRIKHEKHLITCPVCNGNKVVIVIFGDGTQVEVECNYCDKTFPYTWKACGQVYGEEYMVGDADLEIITGMDVRKEDDGTLEITYWFGSHGGHPDTVALTYEEAVNKARIKAALYTTERVEKREKDKFNLAKSYSWNAKHYLDRAEQARKDVIYYENKAKVMQSHIRKEKENAV